jgi:hypothetical protein
VEDEFGAFPERGLPCLVVWSGGLLGLVLFLGSVRRCVGRGLQVDLPDSEVALSAAQRLGHGAPQFAGQVEAWECEDYERGPPVDQAGEQSADDEPERGACGLPDEHVGPDAPALLRCEIVARQRGDGGPGASGDGSERDPRE